MRQAPIKILRIIARLNVGGPAIHAVLLTQGLSDATMRSVLVTGRVAPGEADMQYFADNHGVTPVVLPRLGREISWWNDLVTLWQLFRIMRRERPDIVHTHTAKAGALGRLAGALACVPILVHTYHGHVFHGYFGPLKSKLFVWIECLLGLLTTKIITISPRQFIEICERYRIAPRKKLAVVPLGFELEPFLRPRRKDDGRASACVVGVVGRMVPVKNHALALRAFAMASRPAPNVGAIRLCLVGDGPLRNDLEQQVQRMGLTEQVLFRGWEEDLSGLYEEMDMVLLTSSNEGTPVALIEAMAAGLPFIATKVGGVLDLMVGEGRAVTDASGLVAYTVYDNGVLVSPEDVGGCAAALRYLAVNQAVGRGMGETGRRFARSQFNKERLLEDMRKLYQALLAERVEN